MFLYNFTLFIVVLYVYDYHVDGLEDFLAQLILKLKLNADHESKILLPCTLILNMFCLFL